MKAEADKGDQTEEGRGCPTARGDRARGRGKRDLLTAGRTWTLTLSYTPFVV